LLRALGRCLSVCAAQASVTERMDRVTPYDSVWLVSGIDNHQTGDSWLIACQYRRVSLRRSIVNPPSQLRSTSNHPGRTGRFGNIYLPFGWLVSGIDNYRSPGNGCYDFRSTVRHIFWSRILRPGLKNAESVRCVTKSLIFA